MAKCIDYQVLCFLRLKWMSISNPDSEIIELCLIPILKLTKFSCCFKLYSHQQIYDYFFGQYELLSILLASIL